MEDKSGLYVFPCSYALKVVGRNRSEFYSAVSAIVEKHVAPGNGVTFASRTSRGDKYLSITATFSLESREQLYGLYRELHENELVLLTL
jgi:putative lipoic acid-binding regulatory protein